MYNEAAQYVFFSSFQISSLWNIDHGPESELIRSIYNL
jgi:hypothetical protein